MNINKNITLKVCILAMFAAISVVLVAVLHFPILPGAPFLEYDMADVPVIITTLMFDVWSGLAVLLVTCTVQAFLLGCNGWIGLLMHFVASGALVAIIGIICKKDKSIKRLALSMALGALAMVALMVPMNLLLTPIYMGVDISAVKQLLVPAIIPFNAIKAVLNCVISLVVYKLLAPVLKKYKQ